MEIERGREAGSEKPETARPGAKTRGPEKLAIQLRLLNELSTRLQTLPQNPSGTENFFQIIIDMIQSKFHYFGIHIWSVSHDRSARLEAQSGVHNEHIKVGHTLRPNQGIIGRVISTQRSYLSNDLPNDPHYYDLSLPISSGSELAVPIIKDGELIAIINVEAKSTHAFDEDDVIMLEAVASQVAVAITNQRLYNAVRDFNRALQNAVDEKTLELRRAHERILDQQKLLQKENKALRSLVTQDQKTMELIGTSQSMNNVITMVDKIAPTLATVLIQGESGTGKELIARRLHLKSERGNASFITVNCGALQESLLESELFGHEKGSFTGAIQQKIGLCEMADGGSLFLDEIGEMSLGIQSKLLRFLQEGEFYRIGGKKPIKVDVRVISATNRDLENEVREGRFREDLFYRLNTITLRMPPLRKRREDIPLLVEFFLKSSRFGGPQNQIKRVDPRVMEVFQNYQWPGNIRELQNTIERLKILAENNEIKLEDVPSNIRLPRLSGVSDSNDAGVEMSLEDVEKNHILRTLAFNQGNKTKTAQSLGITIKTLYNKLHRYGLGPEPQSQPVS